MNDTHSAPATLEALRGGAPTDSEASTRRRFRVLAKKWHWETGPLSVTEDIVSHPAYVEITQMGRDALPLILEDLYLRGGLWFDALERITGKVPYGPDERGGIPAMRAKWLSWGRSNGLLGRGLLWKKVMVRLGM